MSSNYLDKLHELPHLEGVKFHLTMQSSQWCQCLYELNALVKAWMHRTKH